MNKLILLTFLLANITTNLEAQDTGIKRSPEELKELFGFCDKPVLIKLLKVSPEMADKIGEIDYWARLEIAKVTANTNERYATPNEVLEDVVKKYKDIRLGSDEIRTLLDYKKAQESNPEPCPVIVLHTVPIFDTLPTASALLRYKKPYRKMLIDKLVINGRQADMLFDIEVWKQKESLNIAKIPESDFDRVRKTVAMYAERDRRCRSIGMSEEQITMFIQFFTEHRLEQ